MATVLDAFASYVQSMVLEMANKKVGMLLGVPGEIEKMGVKLGDLKNFLADADRRNITDMRVQEWVRQLKRAMYEITDILDLCHLKAMEQPDPSATNMGCCNPLFFCLRNPLHAHDIGIRIKILNQRLDSIKERSAAFSFINLGPNEDGRSNMHTSRLAATRETSWELDRSALVGEKIQEDGRKLVEIMVTKTNGETSCTNNIVSVFAIVGVGGIGKTTLAKKVFNDEAIQRYFDTKIWLSVNQNFSEVELLRRAISEAGGDYQPTDVAKATLQRTLKDTLRGKKVFMVMDDVWDKKAWEELNTPLINVAAEGTCILVTTRDERVARGMKSRRPYHRIDKLDDEDGWSLLKKQVVSSETDGPQIDLLKDIGLQIVEKCGGLPLAVKVMGGLLCQKDIQRRDWEMVLNDSIWSKSEMPEELNYAVYLSYEDLSPCLKQCFLYYSLLPKNVDLEREEIIGMWISEGYLHGTSADLEELGSKYHKELILRNLIEPDVDYLDQRVCKMHDIVSSFAQFVARDEALATHSGETSIISNLSGQNLLRLSIERRVSESNGLDWNSLQVQRTLRTLISVGHINLKPGDTLVDFPCLRTIYIHSADVGALIECLDQLKHLRYLCIHKSDISCLPDNIGKMQFLQHISIKGCQQFVELPQSIIKLLQLRYLNFKDTSINGIPRGFRVLTNLRILHGFPAHVDGDWDSLEELGPLYQLRSLGVQGLENVSAISCAEKARLAEKMHLILLLLACSSRVGDDGLIKEEGVSEEEQERIKEVFDQLCPPPNIYRLDINGYFGRRLPRWMMSTSSTSFESLSILFMTDLACCTQLPDGLSRLSCLEFIQISRAPSIKRVGSEFLQPYHHNDPRRSQVAAAFPRLGGMELYGLVEWEEWEWEEHVPAMPILEYLLLNHCKLRCIPHGLASNARALRILVIQYVQYLSYLENLSFVVELEVAENPDLERITNLPSLQKLEIDTCPNLKVLEGVPALHKLILKNYTMETFPEYMRRDVKPRHLELSCSLPLLTSIAAGQSGPEWDKFSHVDHVKAYASDGNNKKKWYVLYTRETCSLDTNVSRSSMSGGTLLSSMVDAQGFEHAFKMRRRTFHYICSLVDEDMIVRDSSYIFADGRVLSLEDQIAVALIALNSGEPMSSLGSSVGVNESIVTLVTERFVEAIFERAGCHISWPDTGEMEKIKFKFDNIHGLPNCCGVVHTTHITFGQTRDHENDESILLQALVDPNMRFTNIWFRSSNMSQMSLLHDSWLFKDCEKGESLNASRLKASPDRSEVGEYMIGDTGYPLLPWLFTPYQENDLSESKMEFNRRHSASTAMALEALARLKDRWKCLHGGMWHLKGELRYKAIGACCRLHNIVIDLEDLHMPRDLSGVYNKQVRQLELVDEDAVRARNILSQHLTSMSSESRGVEGKDQEVHSRDKEEEARARTAEGTTTTGT